MVLRNWARQGFRYAPPDDPLFAASTPAAPVVPQPTSGSPAVPAVADPAAPAPAAPAAAADPRVEELQAQMGQMAGTIAQMGQFFQQLQNQPAPAAPVGGADPNGGGSFSDALYEDPQGAIDGRITEMTGPVVGEAAVAMGTMMIEAEKAKIAGEFGPKAWTEVFAPELDPVIQKVVAADPMKLMNRSAIENAVATVMGKNRTKLHELATAHTVDLAAQRDARVGEVVEQVVGQTNLTGGIRRVAGEDTLPKLDDESSQEFLEGLFRDTGETRDTKRLATMMGTGNTLDDWQKTQDKLTAGEGV